MGHRIAIPDRRSSLSRTIRPMVPLLLASSDLASFVAAFLASTVVTGIIQTRLFERAPKEVFGPFFADRLAMMAFFSCLLLAWFAHHKHYTGRLGRWTEVKHIFAGIVFIALIDGWAHFALKMQASRLWQAQLWVYSGAFIIAGRTLMQRVLDAFGCWRCPALLVGTAEVLAEVRTLIESERCLGYDVRCTVTSNPDDDLLAKVKTNLLRHPDLGYVMIGLQDVPLEQLSPILRLLDENGVQYGLIPPVGGVPLLGFQVDQFLGCDFMVLQRHRPLFDARYKRAAKRCVDTVGAVALLILLAPLLVADCDRLAARGRAHLLPLAPAWLWRRRVLGPQIPHHAARSRSHSERAAGEGPADPCRVAGGLQAS